MPLLINQVPANALPDRRNSQSVQPPIVLLQMAVVMRERDLVDTMPGAVDRCRAFEPGDKKSRKQALVTHALSPLVCGTGILPVFCGFSRAAPATVANESTRNGR